MSKQIMVPDIGADEVEVTEPGTRISWAAIDAGY